MDRALKQRLIGAAVLVAIAVIFLPMLVKGPAPVSGAADVSLDVPAAPQDGFETRELPLGLPGQAPADGVTGMSDPAPASTTPMPDTAASTSPTLAAGDYVVNFGLYGTTVEADRMVAALGQSQLQAYAEPATLSGRSVSRVRIGPFASRAEAEAARLRALHVSDKVKASVIALNAGESPAPAPITTTTTATAVVAPSPVPPRPLPPAPAAIVAKTPTAKPAPVETSKPVTTAKPVEAKPAQAISAAKPAAKPAEITLKPAPKPAAKPAASNVGFAVQLGAFANAAEATALRDRARVAGLSAFTESVKTANGTLTRVRIGPVADRADADRLRAQVQSKLGVGGMVRPHP